MNKSLAIIILFILTTNCDPDNKEINLIQNHAIDKDAAILKEFSDFVTSVEDCADCNYQMAIDKQSDSITLIKFIAYRNVTGEFKPSRALFTIDIQGTEVEVIGGYENLFIQTEPTHVKTDEPPYLRTKCYILKGNNLTEQDGNCHLFTGLVQQPSIKFTDDF